MKIRVFRKAPLWTEKRPATFSRHAQVCCCHNQPLLHVTGPVGRTVCPTAGRAALGCGLTACRPARSALARPRRCAAAYPGPAARGPSPRPGPCLSSGPCNCRGRGRGHGPCNGPGRARASGRGTCGARGCGSCSCPSRSGPAPCSRICLPPSGGVTLPCYSCGGVLQVWRSKTGTCINSGVAPQLHVHIQHLSCTNSINKTHASSVMSNLFHQWASLATEALERPSGLRL